MTITDSELSISEVAAQTGLSPHTLRYYEREGLLLHQVDRASSSHRRYSGADVTWVHFLTKLRSTAMPIARVREYVELARAGDETVEERLALLQQHRRDVLAHLEETQASLAAIDYKIATYKNRIED